MLQQNQVENEMASLRGVLREGTEIIFADFHEDEGQEGWVKEKVSTQYSRQGNHPCEDSVKPKESSQGPSGDQQTK